MWGYMKLFILPTIALIYGPLAKGSQTIRLINGTSRCAGRVEIYHEGQWGTVCDDRWTIKEVEIVCRQMDCGTALGVRRRAYFGEGVGNIWLDDVTCKGTETSLSQCIHLGMGENNCEHREDAGVVCSDSVRLVNGPDRCSGTVEVYHAGQWGTISGDSWEIKAAEIVCREARCGESASALTSSPFGRSRLATAFAADCTGKESSLTQCSLRQLTRASADIGNSAAVTCIEPDINIRLVNGTSRCSGRVEIFHKAHWGIISDYRWDTTDAEVVCKELNCGSPLRATNGYYFGEGSGQSWMDDVFCVGNERSLSHCSHTFGSTYQGSAGAAGVICSETIRLTNGTNRCSGRVDVFLAGQWSPVCDDQWGILEAAVVCRELGCGDPLSFPQSDHFGQGSISPGYTARCMGGEQSLKQCSLREFHGTSCDRVGSAAVICSGNIRLVNGSSRCDGRVEFYRDGQWGTVCGNVWDKSDSKVLCKELKCGHSHTVEKMALFGQGSGKIWINNIHCSGYEQSISHCEQSEFGENTCNHTTDIGVICSESLKFKLTNGTDKCSGRLEVKQKSQWWTVCDRDFTISKAEVVCKMLGCGGAASVHVGSYFGQGSGPVWEASDACFASGETLQNCVHEGLSAGSCGHESDIGVVCGEKMRFVHGHSNCSGRLEILYEGEWGTLCDQWTTRQAEVVCRQFDCGRVYNAHANAHFGGSSGKFWKNRFYCQGSEKSLAQCYHSDYEESVCEDEEPIAVACVGGLPKPQILINPASEVTWGSKVDITCKIEAFSMHPAGGTFILQEMSGSFKMEKFSFTDIAIFTIHNVNFANESSYQCRYQATIQNGPVVFPDGEPAHLLVTVMLEQPKISFISPDLGVLVGPHELEIIKGQRFMITCSINSQYSGGFFYLASGGSKPPIVMSATEVDSYLLASYKLPTPENEDQSNYSCVYSVNISSRSFSSRASKLLKIQIKASSVAPAVLGVLGGLLLLLLLLVVCYLVWKRQEISCYIGKTRITVTKTSREDSRNKDDFFDERNLNAAENLNGRHTQQQDNVGFYENNSSARDAEEALSGQMCFELEPLVNEN